MSFLTTSTSSSFVRFTTRLLVALLIPGLVIAWFLYAAAAREAVMQARNMRWLGQMANQIQSKIRNYDEIVKQNAKERADAKGQNWNDAQRKEKQYDIVDNLNPVDACKDVENLSVADLGQGPLLRFRENANGLEECAKSELWTLVEESIRPGVFDTIVLANREGEVLYQSDTSKLRLTKIDFLWAKQASESQGIRLPGAAKEGAPAAAAAAAPAAGQNAPTTTLQVTRPIGETLYSVYVQPVKFIMVTTLENKGKGDWMLVGLKAKGTGWKDSAPQGLVLVLPLLALLVIVSWPLPRLWYMEASEPIFRRDIALIALCTLAMVLIFTVLGLYFSIRNLTNIRTDQRLQTLADAIGDNFKAEIDNATTQLLLLDNHLNKHADSADSQSSVLESLCPSQVVSPFQYADWTDSKGDKRIRWTSKPAKARKVNVKDREYFKDVRAGRLIQVLNGSKGIALDQVRSRTTGALATMIAIDSALKLDVKDGKDQPVNKDQPVVASIAISPASLLGAVLPADFGFAIIKPSGEVIFHSEASRILVENLFEECQNAPELRAVVARRVKSLIDTTYSGVQHRIYVAPLKGLEQVPWTLVVFRSMEPVRAIRAQSMVGASVLFVCYAIGCAAVLSVGFFVLSRMRRRFAPRSVFDLSWWSRRSPGYPPVVFAGFLLLIIFWRSLDRQSGPLLFYASLGATVLFLLLSATGLRARANVSTRVKFRWPVACSLALGLYAACLSDWLLALLAPAAMALSFWLVTRHGGAQRWITAAWFAWTAQLALCLVIGPAFAFGKIAYEYEAGLYVREVQWDLRHAEEVRRDELGKEIKSLPGIDSCPRMEDRLLRSLGLAYGLGPKPAIYFYGSPGFGTWIWSERKAAEPESRCERKSLPSCQESTPSPDPVVPVPPDTPDELEASKAICGDFTPSGSRGWIRRPLRLLAASEISLDGRTKGTSMRADELEPAGGLWSWKVCRTGGESRLWLVVNGKPVSRSTLPLFTPWNLFSLRIWTESKMAQDLSIAVQFWAGLLAVLAVLLWWADKFRSRVLLLDQPPPAPPRLYDPERDADVHRFFFLIPPGQAFPELPERIARFQMVDLSSVDSSTPLPAGDLCFKHLEIGFAENDTRAARLQLLESALRDRERQIAILCSLNPAYYLRTGGAEGDSESTVVAEHARWSRLLSYFGQRSLPRGTREHFTDFHAVWDTCSEQEKITLIHLHSFRLVNPMGGSVANSLVQRGLIRRKPNLRFDFVSTAFERFVSEAAALPDMQVLVAKPPSRGISPYAIALVLLGVILFFSQEEMTSRLIGFLTTVTGGFEAVRRQLAAGAGPPGGDKGGSTKA